MSKTEKSKQNETETTETFIGPDGKYTGFPDVFGTIELTEIIRIDTGIEIGPKPLRSILRSMDKNRISGQYVSYRFKNGSETVRTIIETVRNEFDRKRIRKSLSDRIRTNENRPKPVLTFNGSGFVPETVTTETEPEPNE